MVHDAMFFWFKWTKLMFIIFLDSPTHEASAGLEDLAENDIQVQCYCFLCSLESCCSLSCLVLYSANTGFESENKTIDQL